MRGKLDRPPPANSGIASSFIEQLIADQGWMPQGVLSTAAADPGTSGSNIGGEQVGVDHNGGRSDQVKSTSSIPRWR